MLLGPALCSSSATLLSLCSTRSAAVKGLPKSSSWESGNLCIQETLLCGLSGISDAKEVASGLK